MLRFAPPFLPNFPVHRGVKLQDENPAVIGVSALSARYPTITTSSIRSAKMLIPSNNLYVRHPGYCRYGRAGYPQFPTLLFLSTSILPASTETSNDESATSVAALTNSSLAFQPSIAAPSQPP